MYHNGKGVIDLGSPFGLALVRLRSHQAYAAQQGVESSLSICCDRSLPVCRLIASINATRAVSLMNRLVGNCSQDGV